MDIRKIKNLIDLVEQSSVREIEITNSDETIRISRGSVVQTTVPMIAPTPMVAPVLDETTTPQISGHAIKSPMVGTFYAAPSPDSTPFVKIGDRINIGDKLCIIEAMKTMNPIESDKAGTISKVLVNSGDAVEFNQILFSID